MKSTMVGVGAAALLLAGLTAGPAAARQADSEIQARVRAAVYSDPRVAGHRLSIVVTDGAVRMSGRVPTLAAKRFAVLQAQKIEGVVAVVDESIVATPPRPDLDLLLDIERRFQLAAAITSRNIEVSVSNGAVLLAGSVQSVAESRRAEVLASEIRGVMSVRNELVVEAPGTRSDAEIASDVEAELSLDVYLANLPVTYTVEGGVVTLAGSVGSAYQRARAENAVRFLPGVREVRNQLAVDPSLSDGSRRRDATVSDSELRTRVRSRLDRDARIEARDIRVAVRDGRVELRGSVPFGIHRRLAEQDAFEIVGVVDVTNEIEVRAPVRTDEAIRRDVMAEFDRDYLLRDVGLAVTVTGGAVSLQGTVETAVHRRHAREVASRVLGVKSVSMDVIVASAVRMTPELVVAAIEESLRSDWTTSPVADRIQVSIHEGVVALTGTVDSSGQRLRAEQIAFETEGVESVRNRLRVES